MKFPTHIFRRALKSKKESTLCLYPFMNMMMNADGTYKPCCKYQGNLTDGGRVLNAETDSLMDAWQADSMAQLRRDLLDNQKPEGCQVCWKEEAAGIRSMRFDSFDYGITKEALTGRESPVRLDIYPSNICNLQCRICSARYSTKWINEARETMGIVEQRHMNLTPENLDWIGRWLPEIREIGLFGGEPLYLKECVGIMELCVETGHARHIKLLINTNATIYSEKLADLFGHFEKVLLNFSIDDIGKRFEYQRKGADWEEAVRNIASYVDHGGYTHRDRIECKLCCTVSSLNIFYLPEFLSWMNATFPGMNLYLNMLHGPWTLSCNNLPPEIKAVIKARLEAIPRMDAMFQNEHRRTVQNVIDFLMSEPNVEFTEFLQEIERGDKYRKESYAEVFPEMWALIGEWVSVNG